MSSQRIHRATEATAKRLNRRAATLVCALAWSLLIGPATAQPPADMGDMEGFYPRVDALTRAPPKESMLKTLCQKRISNRYVALIGVEPQRTLIAAVTRGRLKQPHKSIWLVQKFFVPRRSRTEEGTFNPPIPLGGPQEGTMDWAYIFDRNGDGKVDYLAYLNGPNPVAPEGWADNLPGPEMTGKEFKFYFWNIRMTFWHLADDNFDGRSDGVFIRLRDPKSHWMDAWLIARDRDFDGTFESCQWFEEGPNPEVAKPCQGSSKSYTVRGKSLSGLTVVPPPDNWPILQWINEGAEQCRLAPGALYAAPEAVTAQRD